MCSVKALQIKEIKKVHNLWNVKVSEHVNKARLINIVKALGCYCYNFIKFLIICTSIVIKNLTFKWSFNKFLIKMILIVSCRYERLNF